MGITSVDGKTTTTSRKSELRVFLFLSVLVAPLIAIALVGGYGLSIWVYQMFNGPPSIG